MNEDLQFKRNKSCHLKVMEEILRAMGTVLLNTQLTENHCAILNLSKNLIFAGLLKKLLNKIKLVPS